MCGIIGAIESGGDVRPALFAGLARLEYRGYDSAGAVFVRPDGLRRVRVVGRVADLISAAAHAGPRFRGRTGIAHTRWATHGEVVLKNAHPLTAGRVSVVHNGVIENHAELRRELERAGRRFLGDTDSEVAAHLLDMRLAAGDDGLTALRRTVARLEGSLAIAAVSGGRHRILCARRGSPLLLGTGSGSGGTGSGFGGFYVASDSRALAGRAERVAVLEDGDCAELTAEEAVVADAKGRRVSRKWIAAPRGSDGEVGTGGHRHFMRKEMLEQPGAVAATLEPLLAGDLSAWQFGRGSGKALDCGRATVIGCGTSFHAGLAGRRWMEEISGIPTRAEIASEYRYAPRRSSKTTDLLVAVSQSGETADTLAAMRSFRTGRGATTAVCNTPQSAMAREADFFLPTRAGMEVGVASTKTFTSQMAALAAFSLALARHRKTAGAGRLRKMRGELSASPEAVRASLKLDATMREWAGRISRKSSALFVARGRLVPLALEGALKLKELSYAHAEGLAAGELKHGPLALVERGTPVVGLAPDGELQGKTAANLAEAAARGADLYVLAGRDFRMRGARIARVEAEAEWLSPLSYAAPLQLLSYHAALARKADVDKPRNLAKSVTVE